MRNGFKESGIDMSDKDFDTLFNNIDTSKSGTISYTEYVTAAMDLSILTNEKYLEDAFNFFDTTGKKFLEKDKLRNAMNKSWISDKQLSALFDEVDTNKDNKVFLELHYIFR